MKSLDEMVSIIDTNIEEYQKKRKEYKETIYALLNHYSVEKNNNTYRLSFSWISRGCYEHFIFDNVCTKRNGKLQTDDINKSNYKLETAIDYLIENNHIEGFISYLCSDAIPLFTQGENAPDFTI